MRILAENPWRNSHSHSGLVSVGEHSLWASVSGPVRTQSSPLLIFITGAGACSAVYVKFQEALSKYVRVLFYDRAGYDHSTIPPASSLPNGKLYAMDTARDLTKLLKATQLEPPYIVVAHSFGGIVARSFLELHKLNPSTVVGMVLVNTATELMLQLHKRVPDANLVAVAKNVDWEELTHLREQSGMTDAEWRYVIGAQERTLKGLQLEDTHASAHELALCRQLENQTLGDRPLLVLRFNMASDYRKMYDEGIRLGGGTKDEREKARKFILLVELYHDSLARAQCTLSSDVTYKTFLDYGHDLPIRKPAFVADEIKQYLLRLKAS